ncbi:uncharacterized protein At5g65660-like [Apium graveolens]|uniref:uncharacterized protein At5g65660-like n=1 Tax=Apium graveolens TaxID=4045 RepID=UPI003D7926E9
MESPNYPAQPHHHDSSSRPSLGFPLGTALLLIVIFSLSGIFSCCYHWDKLRSLRRSFANAHADLQADTLQLHHHLDPSKPKPPFLDLNKKQNESLPVLMPGDLIPKFIAMPCKCEPAPSENGISVDVQKPPKPPQIESPHS